MGKMDIYKNFGTQLYTPENHKFTIIKVGFRGSKLNRLVSMMCNGATIAQVRRDYIITIVLFINCFFKGDRGLIRLSTEKGAFFHIYIFFSQGMGSRAAVELWITM